MGHCQRLLARLIGGDAMRDKIVDDLGDLQRKVAGMEARSRTKPMIDTYRESSMVSYTDTVRIE
jgi:hypothetical protein